MCKTLVCVTGMVIGIGLLVLGILALIGDPTYLAPVLFDTPLSAGATQNIAIAPPEQALTFARFGNPDEPRVLLVRSYQNGVVEGADLTASFGDWATDPITLVNRVGYDAIQRSSTSGDLQTRVAVEDLLIPFDTHQHHVAVGANYAEHGEEVSIETQFLFPKIATVSRFAGDLAHREALLDYEVELGMVLLADQALDAPFPSQVGFVLANDFTDRDILVRRIDIFDEASGVGFTDAKSREGFLPMGDLFVVPRDAEAFLEQIKLTLYVNNHLRQSENATAMVWKPEKILQEISARAGQTFPYRGQEVPLLPDQTVIPERTIVLTGTPAGIAFRPPTARQIIAGIPPYVLSFDWKFRSPSDTFLRAAHASRAFLEPGDEVISRADYLGIIQKTIVR